MIETDLQDPTPHPAAWTAWSQALPVGVSGERLVLRSAERGCCGPWIHYGVRCYVCLFWYSFPADREAEECAQLQSCFHALSGGSSQCRVLEILRFSRSPSHPHCCVSICDDNVNFKSVVVTMSGCCNKIQAKITRQKQHGLILARVWVHYSRVQTAWREATGHLVPGSGSRVLDVAAQTSFSFLSCLGPLELMPLTLTVGHLLQLS